jgi:hypothetical protein
MSHKEMLAIMMENQIFCGHDKFARILQDAQRRALAAQKVQEIVESQVSIDGDIARFVDSNFWELVASGKECGCHKCIEGKSLRTSAFGPIPLAATRMILCPTCGNKRCPKASNHALACANSNEPGQPGSVYTNNNTEKTA